MPYQTIEAINTRKSERIARFLTFNQFLGVVVTGLLILPISTIFPQSIRILIIGAFVLLGYLLMTEMQGMTPAQRLLWRMRGMIQRSNKTNTISPDDLPGTVVDVKLTVSWEGARVYQLRPEELYEGRSYADRAQQHLRRISGDAPLEEAA